MAKYGKRFQNWLLTNQSKFLDAQVKTISQLELNHQTNTLAGKLANK